MHYNVRVNLFHINCETHLRLIREYLKERARIQDLRNTQFTVKFFTEDKTQAFIGFLKELEGDKMANIFVKTYHGRRNIKELTVLL